MAYRFQPDLPQERDNNVVRHVLRNKLTTRPALQRLFFPKSTLNAVSQYLRRVTDAMYLARHPRSGRSNYYTLHPTFVSRHRLPRSRGEPFGDQALPRELAALAYCCLGDVVRKRLLPGELRQRYPWFSNRLMGFPYYFDVDIASGKRIRRLASIRVELSGHARYVVQKHIQQLRRYRKITGFARLLDRNEFLLVTITTSPQRRDAIIEEIHDHPAYPPARVFDYPDLMEFL